MSSISPKKRPHVPLWSPWVTSPPDHLTLPRWLPAEGLTPFCKCQSIAHKAPWPCVYTGFHCQGKAGLWEQGGDGGGGRERGVRSWLGGRYSHSSPKVLYSLQQPRRRPQGSSWTMPGPVNLLARQGGCGHFFLSRAGLFFEGLYNGQAMWPHLTSTEPLSKWTHRESPFVNLLSQSK